ncbi:MAG: efflux RND transporter periplasmic adaptor subunit, partial [candidate division Zixibacteria bacterium]|nr:efflux RND transporter periplasmic adaptor subunit [candidate division Zixibacteria bacterium]
MYRKLFILLTVLLLLWFVSNVLSNDNQNPDQSKTTQVTEDVDHSNCDGHHDEEPNSAIHDEEVDHNEDGDHEEEAGHGDEEENDDELKVVLTPDAIKLAGITYSTVNHGSIGNTIELPGEIGFNEDRLAHIAPRFAGIALETNYGIGDFVEKGSAVAVIESNESMNSYSIIAPFSGWVIEKHITQGEFVTEENSIYVIADLSTV